MPVLVGVEDGETGIVKSNVTRRDNADHESGIEPSKSLPPSDNDVSSVRLDSDAGSVPLSSQLLMPSSLITTTRASATHDVDFRVQALHHYSNITQPHASSLHEVAQTRPRVWNAAIEAVPSYSQRSDNHTNRHHGTHQIKTSQHINQHPMSIMHTLNPTHSSAVKLASSAGRPPTKPATFAGVSISNCIDTSRYCRLVRYCSVVGSVNDRKFPLTSRYCSADNVEILDGSELWSEFDARPRYLR